ncbi:MAG: hypothetical protein EA409_02555 [Saprospirales bacterium]|nr:MAG: hypothetical protein EA409_02555 [Saprospirales bacterium]
MFWTPVIETIISLIFTFLILSVICSAIYEWISERRNLRGQLLSRFLHSALKDNTGRLPNIAHMVLHHPLVRSATMSPKREVERIDPEIFADALVEVSDQCIEFMLEDDSDQSGNSGSLPEGVFKSLNFSHGELGKKLDDRIRKEKAIGWYNSMVSMARYHYKRKTRKYLFLTGLLFAIIFNVDSLHLVDRYWSDASLRSVIVAHAEKYLEENQDNLSYQLKWEELAKEIGIPNTQRKVEADSTKSNNSETVEVSTSPVNYLSSMPIGWNWRDLFKCQCFGYKLLNLLMMMIGWIITASAITFGAPFWYDVLQKVFKLKDLKSS